MHQKTHIKNHQIKYEPASCIDPAGKVFYHSGKVYRSVNNESLPLAKKILADRRCEHFFEKGLIRTRFADIKLDNCESVLEHEKIPFVTYCQEWSPIMLKEAALSLCDLSLELAKSGLALKDAHPWNFHFNKCRPYFVDFGSIVELDQSFKWPCHEFRRHILFPLWLFSKGRSEDAYRFLNEHPIGIGKRLIEKKPFNRIPFSYAIFTRKYRRSRNSNPRKSLFTFLTDVKKYISDMRIPSEQGFWATYEQRTTGREDPLEIPPKTATVTDLLKTFRKSSLLDMACNKGAYASIAEEIGYQVLAFDRDPGIVSKIYLENKSSGKDILPLKLDFLWPTAGFGLGLSAKPAFERLKCDTTLVLALVHHLVFSQNVNFEVIARIISLYTISRAIVEFIPPDDHYVKKWMTKRHNWYELSNFIASMNAYFRKHTIFPSSPAPRVIILFEK